VGFGESHVAVAIADVAADTDESACHGGDCDG